MAYDLTRDIVPDTVTDIVRERTSRARYRKISYIRGNIVVDSDDMEYSLWSYLESVIVSGTEAA